MSDETPTPPPADDVVAEQLDEMQDEAIEAQQGDERIWPASSIPYYLDGRRVSHSEYAEHVRQTSRQAALDALARSREGLTEQPTPPEE